MIVLHLGLQLFVVLVVLLQLCLILLNFARFLFVLFNEHLDVGIFVLVNLLVLPFDLSL